MSSLIYERDAFIPATLLQGVRISHCQETPRGRDKFLLYVAYWTWEYKWQRSKQKDAGSVCGTHKYTMHEESWDRVSHFSNRHGSCLVIWFFLLSPTLTYKGMKTQVSTALKLFLDKYCNWHPKSAPSWKSVSLSLVGSKWAAKVRS